MLTRPPRALVPAVLSVLTLLLAVLALPPAQATFSARTSTPANSLSADRLLPPAGLVAAQTCPTRAAVAFRARATAAGLDSLTLPVPTGTVPGDVLLAQVSHAWTVATLAAPSGWVLVRRDTAAATITSALFRKVATAGEPSATFAFPGGSGVRMAGGVAAYSGVSSTAPVDVSAGVGGFDVVATTPSVTTTSANTLLVRLVTHETLAFAAATGTSERWRFAPGGGSPGVTAADEPFVGPGVTGTRASPVPGGGYEYTVGQTVALRRVPAGTPSANLSWSASPSTWATGYLLERRVGGAVQATRTITPVGTTSTSDGPLADGTTYTYELRAERGTWRSEPVTTTLSPSC